MELPRLKELYARLHAQGLEIICVQIDKNKSGAEKFIQENQLSYTFAVDDSAEGTVHKGLYNAFAYPTTFIIGRDGLVHYYHLGFDEGDEAKLEQEIASLLSMR